mmetsp:Transcript_30388/g.44397  ORF Transcript_30388/g.44397 Transcript_30388/m.44397 type:complete len:178 (+) Transcript_30388:3-536(+)
MGRGMMKSMLTCLILLAAPVSAFMLSQAPVIHHGTVLRSPFPRVCIGGSAVTFEMVKGDANGQGKEGKPQSNDQVGGSILGFLGLGLPLRVEELRKTVKRAIQDKDLRRQLAAQGLELTEQEIMEQLRLLKQDLDPTPLSATAPRSFETTFGKGLMAQLQQGEQYQKGVSKGEKGEM